ncbi:MAG: sigma-70 family RNA polymerase sigma factor [Streptosporangiaceae bacterium]|jgi:RNA polymerase sigma-70 factor (ECF subfamily)
MTTDQQAPAAPAAVFGGLGRAEYERLTRELTGYCYRMLGSPFDAEDAVQDTMMRAWRDLERFEGRSSLRTWLYRIATNVCIDMLRGRSRRGVPMDLQSPSVPVESQIGVPLGERSWVLPVPDAWIQDGSADPAQRAVLRESVRLAFVAALQRLTPRQRAVLILRDVLQFSAAESAGLLGTTVASANSALQRARVALPVAGTTSDAAGGTGTPAGTAGDAATDPDPALLDEYVAAFESYDMSRLTAVLRSDAEMSMPPLAMWLRGPEHIAQWLLGPGAKCRGSRLLATAANGCAAYAQYRRDPAGGYAPWAMQVVETDGGRISGLHCYVIPALFAAFGFPSAP